jgi:hypothetical protein
MNVKHFYILLFLVGFSFANYAQNRLNRKDKIKALKTAYITEQVELTPSEAEKFWPIYKAFDDKQFELRHQKMKSYLDRMESNSDEMSDKEASQLLSQLEASEDELYQLRKKFNSDIKLILSAQKIIKLKKAEENFNRSLLKQLREGRPVRKN